MDAQIIQHVDGRKILKIKIHITEEVIIIENKMILDVLISMSYLLKKLQL